MTGLTALVTGASQGIGRQISVALAEHGWNVGLVARSDGIYETEAAMGQDAQTHAVKGDVTDEPAVEHAVRETASRFGRIDCLVNNAGIAGPTARVEDIDLADWTHTLRVNVTGMFLMTKHTVPYLKDSAQASIINISSISGKRPLPNRTPYTASNMAVIGLTRTLAFELGEHGITVNAICPGATRGPRIDAVIQQQADHLGVSFEEAKQRVFTDDTALGMLVEPEDTAEMVAYLASEHARHITAQDINVDAGTTWY